MNNYLDRLSQWTRIAVISGILCAPGLAVSQSFDPAAGNFSKAPDVVRVLCWNVHNNFIYFPDKDGNYQRVIKAVNPDIITFQEIDTSLSENTIATRLQTYFPGTTWNVYLGKSDGTVAGVSNRNVIASRYPLSRTRQDTVPASSIRGVTMAMVDLPNGTFSKNLYVMTSHFKAGDEPSDHESRQRHADAITNWVRDFRTPGGEIDLPANVPFLWAGDSNLRNNEGQGIYHADITMLHGKIYNTATFGSNYLPDWDNTEITDAGPYDYVNANASTHNSSASPGTRPDRFYYADSQLTIVNKFVINTRTMSASARQAAGLQAADTNGASDHLPIAADFRITPAISGELRINEYIANDFSTDDHTFIEIKNIGGEPVNLDAPQDYWVKTSLPLPPTSPSSSNEEFAYDLSGAIPPGGLFVLYDSAGETAALKSVIESSLPVNQRQDISNLMLRNQDYSAFALVSRMIINSARRETNVEAYGYGAPDTNTTRYFRMTNSNNLTVALGSKQWTNFNAGEVGVDLSLARNFGFVTPNDYTGWTIGTTPTPGTENPGASSLIADWSVY